jgi:hypothetical protein
MHLTLTVWTCEDKREPVGGSEEEDVQIETGGGEWDEGRCGGVPLRRHGSIYQQKRFEEDTSFR